MSACNAGSTAWQMVNRLLHALVLEPLAGGRRARPGPCSMLARLTVRRDLSLLAIAFFCLLRFSHRRIANDYPAEFVARMARRRRSVHWPIMRVLEL